MNRRDLLTRAGLGAAALATTGFGPASRLSDTRTAVAADAPAISFARVGAPRTDAQARVLASLDDTHRMLGDGAMEVLLHPGDLARLHTVGADVTVIDADLFAAQRVTSSRATLQMPGESSTGDYRRWEDFEEDLRALVAEFPNDARMIRLPGASLLGFQPWGIEIATDVGAVDGRPIVVHDGMHHSREWPAAEMPIMWAHDLLQSNGSDTRITAIVDNVRSRIIPNLNPDGFIRSRESLITDDSSNPAALLGRGGSLGSSEAYWRKNLRSYSGRNTMIEPGVDGVRYGNPDAYGIDLNRNYGFLWGDDVGSSGSESSQTYRGAAPYSEPETANVRALYLASAPVTGITHHTSGGIMLHPWGRDPDSNRSRDWKVMNDIGVSMSQSNAYVPKQSFGLYPTSGTSRDWGHAATSTLIWTFEHGTEFHGSYAETVPAMYEVNRGAFMTHAEMAMDPSTHLTITGRVVTADGSPYPTMFEVYKDQTGNAGTPVTGGTFVDDPILRVVATDADGYFELHLPPSTRPFLEEAPADLEDVQSPTGNVYAGGFDAVLGSHGLTAGTEPYVLRFPGGVDVPVTGGRGDVVDDVLVTLASGPIVVGISAQQVSMSSDLKIDPA
jgi:hypothetical protein